MIAKLLKKEFCLCSHPTNYIFSAMCLFVFIPNYPYGVMFFFAGLSVFFVCLTARENGDAAMSCTLPVPKVYIPIARILMSVIFQCVLIILASICVAIKQLAFAPDAQINLAGNAANTAFIGYGFVLLGLFNIIFFPLHFKCPEKVGVLFIIASCAVFLLIAVGIALRFTAPFVTDVLNTPDPQHLGVKLGVLLAGFICYAVVTVVACVMSARNFVKVDF